MHGDITCRKKHRESIKWSGRDFTARKSVCCRAEKMHYVALSLPHVNRKRERERNR